MVRNESVLKQVGPFVLGLVMRCFRKVSVLTLRTCAEISKLWLTSQEQGQGLIRVTPAVMVIRSSKLAFSSSILPLISGKCLCLIPPQSRTSLSAIENISCTPDAFGGGRLFSYAAGHQSGGFLFSIYVSHIMFKVFHGFGSAIWIWLGPASSEDATTAQVAKDGWLRDEERNATSWRGFAVYDRFWQILTCPVEGKLDVGG